MRRCGITPVDLSLQGELLSILEDSLNRQDKVSPQNLLAELRQRGLRTPRESATIVKVMGSARTWIYPYRQNMVAAPW